MYVNLKVCLWQSGLRQNRLAQALQMDEALLSRIINGYREPTREQRTRIAEFLHRDETWLFARDSETAEGAARKTSGPGASGEAVAVAAATDTSPEETEGSTEHSQI